MYCMYSTFFRMPSDCSPPVLLNLVEVSDSISDVFLVAFLSDLNEPLFVHLVYRPPSKNIDTSHAPVDTTWFTSQSIQIEPGREEGEKKRKRGEERGEGERGSEKGGGRESEREKDLP